MHASPTRSSLPKIRKLVPKNYVDIGNILQPSPPLQHLTAEKGSMQNIGSLQKLDCRKATRRTIKSDSNREINEIASIFIQLNLKEEEKNLSSKTLKGRSINKWISHYKSSSSNYKYKDSVSSDINNNKHFLDQFNGNSIKPPQLGFVGSRQFKSISSRIALKRKLNPYLVFENRKVIEQIYAERIAKT